MSKVKSHISVIFLFFVVFCFSVLPKDVYAEYCTGTNKEQGSCYLSYDFGFSTGVLKVKSNCGCKDLSSKDYRCGECPWETFDPILYTKGNEGFDNNANNIAISVAGGWRPWGALEISGKECVFNTCTEGVAQGCHPDGKKIDKGKEQENIPCCESNAYGLYGLIALDGPDGPQVPDEFGVLDYKKFVTFRVGPLNVRELASGTSEDEESEKVKIKTFVLDHVNIWDSTSQKFIKKPVPKGGVIYFKIEDSYYNDNIGSYDVIIRNGVFSKEQGFIEKLIRFFLNTFDEVSDVIYNNIVKNSGFRDVVRVVLLLFVTFNAIFFMLGLIEINQTELIVRFFKVGIIVTLISDTTLGVIPDLFKDIITWSIKVAGIIMKESMYDSETDRLLLPFPNLNNVFSAYDGVIDMFISKAFNVKIWALLFTSKFYLILGIYICVVIILIGMWKALIQYILSFFLLALLIIILPIFLVTILFKQTMHLFDNWIEQFIASCLMLIVVTATVALMLSLIITQLQDLLYYTVCWKTIFEVRPLDIVTIIRIKFWKPDDWGEFSNSMTPIGFFYVLISSVLFRVYMDYVPELVDALGGVVRRPLSGLYNGMRQNYGNLIHGSMMYKLLNTKVFSPIKQRLGLLHYIDRGISKVSNIQRGAIAKGVSDLYKGTKGSMINNWRKFTGDPSDDLGAYNLARESNKLSEAISRLKQKLRKGFGSRQGKSARDGVNDLSQMDRGNEEQLRNLLVNDREILDSKIDELNYRYNELALEKDKILEDRANLNVILEGMNFRFLDFNKRAEDFEKRVAELKESQKKDKELYVARGHSLEAERDFLEGKYGDEEGRLFAECNELIEENRQLTEEKASYTNEYKEKLEEYQAKLKDFDESMELLKEQMLIYEEQRAEFEEGMNRDEINPVLNQVNQEIDNMWSSNDLIIEQHQDESYADQSEAQSQIEEQKRRTVHLVNNLKIFKEDIEERKKMYDER